MGFISSLISAKEEKTVPLVDQKQNLLEAIKSSRKLVGEFVIFMNSSDYPEEGFVADAAKLPIGKETLKTALRLLISTTEDKAMKESLKAAYISLAYFQKDVGNKDIGVDFIDFSKKLASCSATQKHEVIRQYAADCEASKLWLSIATNEIGLLAADVASL